MSGVKEIPSSSSENNLLTTEHINIDILQTSTSLSELLKFTEFCPDSTNKTSIEKVKIFTRFSFIVNS